jgi:KipI family sensor histidine kinase inhibitor
MFRYASDQSLFLDIAPADANLEVLARIPGVVNLHPAYESILIVFNPLVTTHDAIKQAAAGASSGTPKPHKHHEIPVQYNGADLDDVAMLQGLSRERVIELHAAGEYTVAFLGFVPGFAYLTGLHAALRTPRRPSPRKAVPAGSLGIAGDQTAIYPISTPGGWQLIGNTSLQLFDPANTPMSLLQPGDHVKFIAL